MKKILYVAILAVFAGGMTGCEMFNIDVDSVMSTNLNIQVEESAAKSTNAHPFNASNTINPLDDDDVMEYADKIVNVGVNGIIATVQSVSDSEVYFLAGTVITVSNESISATYTLDEDWLIEQGATVSIEDLGGFYDDLSDILLEMEEFTVTMSGYSSKSGVTVTIKLDIDTTITGNPF